MLIRAKGDSLTLKPGGSGIYMEGMMLDDIDDVILRVSGREAGTFRGKPKVWGGL